jgi:cytochrome c oxidase subunit I
MNGISDTLDHPDEGVPGQLPVLARLHEWVVTVDHKRLGIMYVGVGLVFLLVAGLEATLMRLQLAFPDNTVLSPQVFNRLFTMHGTTMVFFVGIPIVFGFGLPGTTDDRHARPGLSAAERFWVLVVVLQRPAPLL